MLSWYHFSVTGLMEGHDYTFRVSAENDLGVGEPCHTDVPTRAKGAIGTSQFSRLVFTDLYHMTLTCDVVSLSYFLTDVCIIFLFSCE